MFNCSYAFSFAIFLNKKIIKIYLIEFNNNNCIKNYKFIGYIKYKILKTGRKAKTKSRNKRFTRPCSSPDKAPAPTSTPTDMPKKASVAVVLVPML